MAVSPVDRVPTARPSGAELHSSLALVTVLVVARDEASAIVECLESIATQDYPLDRIEVVLVIDGLTKDDTARRARRCLEDHGYARVAIIENSQTGTPSNLNCGLDAATGAILCRVDARSRIPRHYVRRCAASLCRNPQFAVVGGSQVAVPGRSGTIPRGIARALNNRWGMGLARYRRGASSGPADTVYLGAFRVADLLAVGGWALDLPTNQDFDLNRRLGQRGMVWFDADLPVDYIPRSDLASLYRQYVRFGSWKVRYWRLRRDRPRPRQLMLLVGVPAAAVGVGAALLVLPSAPRALLIAALLAGGVVIEVAGSVQPDGGVVVHASSAGALATVAAGWLLGAWTELLAPGR